MSQGKQTIMADAKKDLEIKPEDMHATGGEASTDDMHATSEPAN